MSNNPPLYPKSPYLKKKVTVSAGILSSLMAFSTLTSAVEAQELDLNKDELLDLYEQYTALAFANEEKDEVPHLDDSEEALPREIEDTDKTELTEEMEFLKTQLTSMIKLAGGEDILEQLHNDQLSVEQLDTIFNALIEKQLAYPKADKIVAEDESEEDKQAETLDAVDPLLVEAEVNEDEIENEEETVLLDTALLEASIASYDDQQAAVQNEEAEQSNEKSDPLREASETIVEEPEAVEEKQEAGPEAAEKESFEKAEAEAESKPEVKPEPAPEPKPAPESKADEKPIVYVVKSGDTLSKIAQTYNTTVARIASLNNITNVNRLSVGQVLAINEAGISEAKKPQPTTPGNIGQANTPAAFINQISGFAQEVAAEHGLYASVMIAQASLESGYGRSSLSLPPNHNLFGIKGSYQGQTVAKQTREYYAHTGWITIVDNFKKYPSYEESLRDNAALLRRGTSWNPRFYSGTWIENTKSYRDATAWLQGRYATDPTYANKLNNLIQLYDLTRFDVPVSGGNKPAPVPNPAPVTPSPSNPFKETANYTVVRGDTLSKIAREYKTTVQALKTANNISSDLIFVGQTLIVPKLELVPSKPEQPKPVETPPKEESKPEETKPETPDVPVESEINKASYTVVRGDTLTKIARDFKVTIAQIREANNLRGDMIFVNQKLLIPLASSEAPKPVEPSQPVDTVKPGTASYTVKAGDTLSQIARTHKTTVAQLREWNNLENADRIFVGQRLVVSQNTVKPPKVEAPTPTQPGEASYTVKAGDTLSGIARTHKTTVAQLRDWNNLENADRIFVGQRLVVSQNTVEPPKVETPTPTQPGEASYTVKAGDTLSRIARTHKTTVEQLREWNNLENADRIFVGQRLVVSQNTVEPPKVEAPTPTQPGEASYTVKAGDTLSGIARTHKTTVAQLREWNNLENADRIFVGQRLVVSQNTVEPPKVETPTPTQPGKASYTVKAGDTLSQIARTHKTTVEQLREWNNLENADRIFVGQRLVVSQNTAEPPKVEAPTPTQPGEASYTVKAGDTLSGIARTHKTTVAQLREWNKLKSDIIFVNQKLVITNQKPDKSLVENQVKSHTVSSGETLSHIAREYNLSVRELKELNHLTSDLIFVNQKLNVTK